ncbi:MAG: magnesium and cobalt transport protein CorA [Desulfobacterales bacterium GWB2_56_26]|nr:MAG: magnesium and cobalt transport protein CorA [Desulfobacterales bacterium GWB2_56_26]
MAESLYTSSAKVGLPPGAIVHVGDVHQAETRISLVDYGRDHTEERRLETLDDLIPYRERESVTWIIVEGLADAELVGRLGEFFAIHPLVVEDILNVHQRPKFEEHEQFLFIVLKSLIASGDGCRAEHEQVSIVLLENFVLVFKEKSDELLDPLIQRIRTSKGRLRSLGADYLAYAILDLIVDGFFCLVDSLDEAVNSLEDTLLTAEPTHDTLLALQRVKRELIHIRRYVAPIREVMAAMLRSESELIQEKTRIYLRDVSDHAIRVAESIDSFKDILASLMDIYVSSVSNRLNEVMKVLTIFASIFIPLTFLTGIYGMNFEYMPELKWKYAYFCLWGLFLVIPLALLRYFKKKKWL